MSICLLELKLALRFFYFKGILDFTVSIHYWATYTYNFKRQNKGLRLASLTNIKVLNKVFLKNINQEHEVSQYGVQLLRIYLKQRM